MLVRQVNDGRAEVENEFTRAVTPRRQRRRRRRWSPRCSSCAARSSGAAWARCRTARCGSRSAIARSTPRRASASPTAAVPDNKACECGAILRGVKKPTDCKVFGTVCTPENPIGSCMVSSEGACAAHYTYGRFKDVAACRGRRRQRASHERRAQRLRAAARLQARPRRHVARRRRARDGAAHRRAVPARVRQRLAARRATTARCCRRRRAAW